MIDFSLAEEFDGVAYVGIVDEAEDVIVGHARLLFGGEVLVEIGEHIALDGEGSGVERNACGGNGIDTCGVVDEVGVEARALDFLGREVSGQLIQDRGYHFHVCEFFRTNIS